MDLFKCKYLPHENEEVIGFCLNWDCQNTTQYCFECLNTKDSPHSQHFNDCIRFTKMIQFMKELIQVNNQLRIQFKDVYIQLQNNVAKIQKHLDQEISTLENMTQQLQNKEYLACKSQILIIKQLYSKEKENCKCIFFYSYILIIEQQIIQFNNILDTLKKMLADQTKMEEQIDSGCQKDTIVNQQSEDQKNQLNFEDAQRLLNQGVALSNLKKYQEAIECYDKAISINPKQDLAWNNKGNSLNNLNKYEEAIECYDKAISINPKLDLAWNNKGNSLDDLYKYQEAIECYDKAISINPKLDLAWNNKGNSLNNLNKYEEAIECYDKAISINPKLDLAWNNKGNSLNNLNKYEEAIECYDKAISINPKLDLAWNNKGNSLFNLNKNEEANECCHQAISINPNNDAAWNNKVKTIYIKNLLQFQLFKQSFLLLIFQSSPFQCFYPSITGFLIFVNKLKEFKYGLTTKLPIL
ncbi:unnamed protein product [Paramecium octaurelia]|uniref:Tetratricopeptide repeat protein n=1 Tax=Paramecium octaurelia TaxID=43137 RepID=A0A8S1YPK7_PAROT|nr:unnamed protein product [Paramecium octaurelia]